MITWLRRRNLALVPLNELQAIGVFGLRYWRATGPDPAFTADWRPEPGWYLISSTMEFQGAPVAPALYFDWGTGFTEVGSVRWTAKTGEDAKRIVWFGDTPNAVRFDPTDRQMDFRLTNLSVRRVSGSWAKPRLIRKVRNAVARGLLSPTEIEPLAQNAGGGSLHDWYMLYDRCFQRGNEGGYAKWRCTTEVVERERLAELPKRDTGFDLLVPVWNTSPQHLSGMIDSVLQQTHERWRLLLVDDASSSPETQEALRRAAARDSRILVKRRSANGGIAAASQTALEQAAADWVALLDHDDLLHPNALRWIAEAIHERPDARFIYTDEDKVADGRDRHDAFFKPEFNLDLLLSQNYIGHFLAFRREDALAVGGFRAGYDGSQDHDLVLRLVEKIEPKHIVHVPWVAYHWRVSARSTAQDPAAKPYTREAGRRAVEGYLQRRGVAAMVEEGRFPNTFRVRWPLPDPAPLVSLIVPTRDGGEVLARCLDGILHKTDYRAIELLIVDNQSVDDHTREILARASADTRVRVLTHDAPFNYSAINNRAVAEARGQLIGLVNDDIEVVHREWLGEMVSLALRPEVGCVGAKLLYPDGTIQHAGVILGLGGVAGHSHKHFAADHPGYFRRLALTHEVSAVTAACMVVRNEVYRAVGGLDEQHLAVAFNDVDFCLRVREAGYHNVWTPWAELIHHESKTRGADTSGQKLLRFQREIAYMKERWADILPRDPFYSPNLTRDREDFGVA